MASPLLGWSQDADSASAIAGGHRERSFSAEQFISGVGKEIKSRVKAVLKSNTSRGRGRSKGTTPPVVDPGRAPRHFVSFAPAALVVLLQAKQEGTEEGDAAENDVRGESDGVFCSCPSISVCSSKLLALHWSPLMCFVYQGCRKLHCWRERGGQLCEEECRDRVINATVRCLPFMFLKVRSW
jgi:hypothetical protein